MIVKPGNVKWSVFKTRGPCQNEKDFFLCREVIEYNDVTVPLARSDREILEGKVHSSAVNDTSGDICCYTHFVQK